MKLKKEIRQLLRSLGIEQGAVARTCNGHLKINVFGNVVFTGSTPSDPRSIKNLSAQLKRAGKKSPKSATSKTVL